ncbi:hypothetical protein FQ087_06045 [Sporosarcina sp. ANT_H38]|uniref:phage tail fiber protein n=1 Tax=Sporosarcina sp. ANT_H38 TaxID=2597358 RepID=UPI0011F20D46|nr:hypothetical protein [Sporosarcina sp. ANT_H38]KAA0965826.1 hypothetical protein FQ087_06045 [Sporosarcina sp. ANT_H38]
MNLSNHAALAALSNILGSSAYVALYTANPTAADNGTEVMATEYKRQPASLSNPANISGLVTSSNTRIVRFEKAIDGYGVLTHVGIRDSIAGGNLLFYTALHSPISVDAGMGADFHVGELRFTMG